MGHPVGSPWLWKNRNDLVLGFPQATTSSL